MIINNKMIKEEYPRYSKVEIQDHVIKCKETRHLRVQYVKDLTKEIIKENPLNIEVDEIFSFIEDILRYLENNESKEY